MKKTITFILLILILIIVVVINFLVDLSIEKIELISFNIEKNEIEIKITKKNNLINLKDTCKLKGNDKIYEFKMQKNECNVVLPIGSYNVYVENIITKSEIVKLEKYVNNMLNFEFKKNKIFLAVNGSYDLEYIYKSLDNKVEFEYDNEIIKIKDNKIIGLKEGMTKIIEKNTREEVEVIVTNLIQVPAIFEKRKEIVPCNKYNETESKLLDDILEDRVKDAGLKTRAGVVAAARFLTLEFPYRIPYFYENGRLNNTGTHLSDGEGRYYHKGLYLNNNKKNDLQYIVSGPVIWGCPLFNWEDDEVWGYKWGEKKPNGLDCSGFVTWALKNGGFEPGDRGAGESEYPNQVTDLGDFRKLTNELIESNTIKIGDIFNYWGHVSVIVGIDEDNYYVSESLPDFGGVVTRVYKKSKIKNTFTHVVLMDDYYKEDGHITNMW